MESTAQQRTQKYVLARKQQPAWLLLASPRAPLVLGCLTSLFEYTDNGIAEEDALQSLSHMLSEYASQDEYQINSSNPRLQAGRELREWIKRGLVIERIREVYGLATGLRADFRRVEDSWREADRQLRQSIMSEKYHRGDIVDRLLEGQEALLNTPEGRVFDSFLQQLRDNIELDNKLSCGCWTYYRCVKRIWASCFIYYAK